MKNVNENFEANAGPYGEYSFYGNRWAITSPRRFMIDIS
jgi:hypothetical protein